MKPTYRICLCTDNDVNETWDTLKGDINDVFVNSQYTHVRFKGCDEVMEAKAVYSEDGKPLVFIGLDVTEEYKKHLIDTAPKYLKSKTEFTSADKRDLIMRDICEMESAEPKEERTVCVNYEDLYALITKHII